MEDHFTFESRYLGTRTKMFRIRTSDQTEWTVFDQWLRTQRKPKVIVQRLTFRKENFYDNYYRINLEIKCACGNVDGTISISKKAERILTKIIISPALFKSIKLKNDLTCPCKDCKCNRQFLCGKELSDILRYNITITRLQEFPNDPLSMPQREKFLKFSDQMSSIFESEQFSDFVIHCDNHRINVHKNILCARASYFRSMLTLGMIETDSNETDFKDTNITALREMLHFLYSGVLRPVTLTVVHDLFVLSDKHQIDDLNALCSEILQKHISCHNAASFLELADQRHAENLKRSCVKFIARNFEIVKRMDGGFEKLDISLIDLIESIKNSPDPLTDPGP